jgi:hypothetical protein
LKGEDDAAEETYSEGFGFFLASQGPSFIRYLSWAFTN